MAMDINSVTVVGNLAADPEVRIFPSGATRCSFRVALNGRSFDPVSKEWRNKETVWMRVVMWRDLAANVGASLRRGDRVIVVGKVHQWSYDAAEGDKRIITELDALTVGVDLSHSIATVMRVRRGLPTSADRVPTEDDGIPEPTDAGFSVEIDDNERALEPLDLADLARS